MFSVIKQGELLHMLSVRKLRDFYFLLKHISFAVSRFEYRCRGWDTNPRTHTGPDLKPGAFDHLSHPCRPPNYRKDLKKTLRQLPQGETDQPPSTLMI